ncbi:MAG: hypothetical protein RBT71_00595 [Flavobacteriales bacterium]|jgi:uncharacterized delta-60 repeat protein|nr:hypothetical protein [Flavobacteriales bacterium]
MRCLYALSALLLGASATAQDYQLSPLFGTGGVVQAEPWDGSASAVAHALRADGSLIVAGTGYWNQPNSFRVTIAAIDTACGNPQADVGGDGTVVRHFEQRTTSEHLFMASDGKLIGCGTTAPSNGVSGHKPSVFRFHADGSIDSTFNGAGYHKSSFDAVSSGRFWTCMEQPDGKLVCAGLSYPNINGGTHGVGVQRFLPDGTLDAGFSGDGIARIATSGTGYTVENCGTGLLLPDGKTLVAAVLQSGPDRTIGLARFTPAGTPDPDFGANGLLITPVACADGGTAGMGAALLPDGRVLVSASAPTAAPAFLMACFTPDGALDATYGTAGVSLVPAGTNGVGRRMALLPDGGTLQFGAAHPGSGPPVVVKRLPGGQPDPAFGSNGVLTVATGMSNLRLWGGLVLPSGRIIGYGEGPGGIVVLRLTTDPGAEHFVDLGPDLALCPGESVLLDAGDAGTDYLWSDGGTGPTFLADTAAVAWVSVTDALGCTDSDTVLVQLLEGPPVPLIDSDNGILLHTDATGELQWQLNGTAIPGATGSSWPAQENGLYTVAVTDTAGCTALSEPFEVVSVGIAEHGLPRIGVHPVPATTWLQVEGAPGTWTAAVAIDARGRTSALPGITSGRLDISALAPGTYAVRLTGAQGTAMARFIKM